MYRNYLMARQREFNKDEVLQQAMMVFWSQGYEATSIRDLISATGISSSSMYEVFGDKRRLFLAALARFCELERTHIVQLATNAPTPQIFIENLFASVDVVVQMDPSASGSLAFNTMVEFGMLDDDITRLLLEHYVGIVEIVAGILEQGQISGTVATRETPLHIAYTILSTLHGVATLKRVKPDFAYRDSITQVVLRLLNL